MGGGSRLIPVVAVLAAGEAVAIFRRCGLTGAAVAVIDYRGAAAMSGLAVQNADVRVVRVGR
jgi:hypothetical protein